MAKRGRPTKFKPEYIEQARVACERLEAEDEDLAMLFGVSETTINNWKNEFPEFLESLKRGKRKPDLDVELSLHKRATGYTRIVQRVTKDGDVVDTTEEVPPDTTACIFWLKNRRRESWRDRQDIEHSGTVNVTPIFELRIKEKGE